MIFIELKTAQVVQQAQQQQLEADNAKENQYPAFEVQAEGGLATTTPRVFKMRPSEAAEKEVHRLGNEAEAHYRVSVPFHLFYNLEFF